MSEYIVERVYDQTTGLDHFGRREEVVRCRDCAFSKVHDGNEYPIGERGSVYCLAWSDGMQGKWTKPEGFCHKGKRKEGGDD